jgi:hypothetical protein
MVSWRCSVESDIMDLKEFKEFKIGGLMCSLRIVAGLD